MTLYDEMIRVPLLMIPPSDTNSTVDTPVMPADLLPTVLDIAGVQTKKPLRGTSLETIVDTDDNKSESRTIISHATSPSDPQRFYESDDSTYFGCTRVDTKKLHYTSAGNNQLFDLTLDPCEINDISAENPIEVEEMEKQIKDSIRISGVNIGRHQIDDEMRETLEQLGYLGGEI